MGCSFMRGRRWCLGWVRQEEGQKGGQMYNLLGQRGSEGLVREEVKLDQEQEISHFGRMLGEAGVICEMKLEAWTEYGTSS